MTVLDRVDRYVARHHHVERSFVRKVLSGSGTRAGLRDWAVQKFHQTYHQNRCFSAIHANCPYEDVRQFMVEQLIAEETGLAAGSASHYELMRRFALAMGAEPHQIAASRPSAAVRRFVDFLLAMCRQPSFVDGMLPIYINESQAKDSAARLYVVLRDQFGLDGDQLEWFSVHGDCDHEHSSRARALIAKYGEREPDFERRAMAIAEQSCSEWLALHDYYGSLLDDAAVPALVPEWSPNPVAAV